MGLKPYDEYKETDVFWLNSIPKHWKWLYLSQVCKEQQIKNSDNFEKNVLSLSYGNIIKKKNIDFGLVPKEYTGYQIIDAGNIIMRLTDLQNDHTSLRTGLVKERGIITSAYTCLKTEHNPAYIHYLLHSYDTIKIFYGMGGGVRQSIGYNDIRRMRLPVPPLEEQEQIVKYLDIQVYKINKYIRAKKKQIALLKEQKQAIINQAVTKGLNPDAKMKPSDIDWLGDIPEGWEIRKLKKITSAIGDGLHGTPIYDDDGQYYFLNGNNLGERTLKINNKTNRVSEKEYQKYKIMLNNTILISLNGTIGNLSFYYNEPVILSKSAGYINLLPCININYIYYYLQTSNVKEYFYLSFAGTTINNLSLDTLRNTTILFPNKTEQQDIVNYLENKVRILDKTIGCINKEIELIAEYRTCLISDVVTGKVDVRNIKINEAVPEPIDEEFETDTECEDDSEDGEAGAE